jgi:hypothetical protein
VQEKRRYKRFKVEVKGIKGEMMLAKDVEIIDISVGGILLKSDKRLNPGNEHVIKLKHKDKVVSVRSRVVWSLLSGSHKNLLGELSLIYTAGMQFINVPNEIINEIAHFIEEYKEEEDKTLSIYISSEHRLYVRYHIATSEKATLDFNESCKVKQISLSGMLIEGEHAQEIEDRLQMQIFLSEDKPINLLGRVASCLLISDEGPNHFDIGIEFLEMSTQDEVILKAFVNSLHGKNKVLSSLQKNMGDKKQDKRQDKRFIKRCETEFTVDGITHRGITSNLSLNGLFISTNRSFPPDTRLDIVIHLPNGSTSKLKGRVRRALKTPTGEVIGAPVKSFKNGMGVEIIENDDNYLEVIKLSLA